MYVDEPPCAWPFCCWSCRSSFADRGGRTRLSFSATVLDALRCGRQTHELPAAQVRCRRLRFAPAPPPPAGGAPCSQFSAPHPVSKPPGRSSGVTPEHPGTARTPTLGGPVRPPVSGNGPLLRPADIEGDLVLVPSFPSPSSFRPSVILSSVALERPQLVCVCVAHAESPVSPPRLSS